MKFLWLFFIFSAQPLKQIEKYFMNYKNNNLPSTNKSVRSPNKLEDKTTFNALQVLFSSLKSFDDSCNPWYDLLSIQYFINIRHLSSIFKAFGFPMTINKSLALDIATLKRLALERNPMCSIPSWTNFWLLTVVIIIIFRSCPWNESTVPTLIPGRFLSFSTFSIILLCRAKGVTMPISSADTSPICNLFFSKALTYFTTRWISFWLQEL